MVREAMEFVKAYDPELGNMIEAEYKRQQRNIELIASENIVSEAVMAAMGSVLTNKYAEGYPGKRYYGGCECVDEAGDVWQDQPRLRGIRRKVSQTFSRTRARRPTMAVYTGALQAGRHGHGHEPCDNGGHLTHGSSGQPVPVMLFQHCVRTA